MENISQRQLYLIGIAYILNATLISVTNQVITMGRMDSWLSYLLAGAVFVPVLWIMSRVSARYAGGDLFAGMIRSHPIWGRGFTLIFTLFFLLILIRDLRMITDFVNIILLPLTPYPIIVLMIALTLVIIVRGGLEIVGRMTELWLPVLIVILLLIPLLLFQEFELRFLQPVFYGGLGPSVSAAWYILPYVGEVVALPLMVCLEPLRVRTGMIALAWGTALLLLVNYYTILSLGTHIPGRVLYPSFEMVRQIRLTDFLDRFDLPLVGVYLPTMLTKIAYSMFIVCRGLQRLLPGISARKIAFPIGLLSAVCSIWFFDNTTQMLDFNRQWPLLALPVQVGVPVLMYIILRPKQQQKLPEAAAAEPG